MVSTMPIVDPDLALLDRLRSGDEVAFVTLLDRYAPSMLRVAQLHTPSRAVAEEVVQETWLGVLRGLEGFEGRAALRTWIVRILVNRARPRGEREHRTVPFATLADAEASEDFSAVDEDRFLPADHDRWPHHWATPPRRWEESPHASLDTREARDTVLRAIADLPPAQRAVMTMRDVEGWDAAETCAVLELSEGNQRVLLHRARSRVRAVVEEDLGG
jgi:RNA polymerase sigma-70 factor (ECF subfamily)